MSGRSRATGDIHGPRDPANIPAMATRNNDIQETVPATPGGEGVVPSLSPRPAPKLVSKDEIVDTLLGKHDLVALDEAGRDPYNATGRHFRR